MEKEDDPKNHTSLLTGEALPPAFGGAAELSVEELRTAFAQAVQAWLLRTPSIQTRENYDRDLRQFLDFCRIAPERIDELTLVRPEHVAAWREQLQDAGLANSTVRRKLTVLRSLYSYLQVYGYTGANPAHGKFVKAPSVPRDGKTVALSTTDCRRLMDAPDPRTPVGVRDRAIFAVLAYSACRVGELVRIKVSDFKTSGEHRVLAIYGKGGKERTVPLHLEAVERLKDWIAIAHLKTIATSRYFRRSRRLVARVVMDSNGNGSPCAASSTWSDATLKSSAWTVPSPCIPFASQREPRPATEAATSSICKTSRVIRIRERRSHIFEAATA